MEEKWTGRPPGSRNRRRTAEEKALLVQKYNNSGIGYQTFAVEHDINPSTFYGWIQRYREAGIEGLQKGYKKSYAKQLSVWELMEKLEAQGRLIEQLTEKYQLLQQKLEDLEQSGAGKKTGN